MKNVHQRERESRLLESLSYFSKPEVRKVKPEGLSREDFIRLIMANGIVSSVRMANDYFATLLYSGKIGLNSSSESSDPLFVPSSEVRTHADLDEEYKKEAETVLDKLGKAKSKTA